MDLVAKIDHAEKAASETARILAAFYRALESLDEASRAELTIMYAKKILKA